MASFQFYYLFLNSFLKLGKLDLVLNFISSSEGEGKQLGISVATRSDFLWNLCYDQTLCTNEIKMLILARFGNSHVENASKKCKSLRADPFGRNLSHVELSCWMRAVSVESTLSV